MSRTQTTTRIFLTEFPADADADADADTNTDIDTRHKTHRSNTRIYTQRVKERARDDHIFKRSESSKHVHVQNRLHICGIGASWPFTFNALGPSGSEPYIFVHKYARQCQNSIFKFLAEFHSVLISHRVGVVFWIARRSGQCREHCRSSWQRSDAGQFV